MSKKAAAASLALMLVLAGCGHRPRPAVARPAPTTPSAISPTSTPATATSPAPSRGSTSSAGQSRPAPPTAPAARPVTAAQLLSAPVPSLCRHSPGRLVNGKLPGIPAGHGVVELASVDGYRADDELVAIGDLDGDRVADAAAVFACDGGGVTWPDEIVFYGPGPTVLGSFDMYAAVNEARVGTRRISYADGRITVYSTDLRPYDGLCCASGIAVASLRWDGKKIVLAGVQHLPGPASITADGIGSVRLGMTAQQLSALGYRAAAGAGGCLSYTAADKPAVTYDPVHHRVVAITSTPYEQTYLGGLAVGDQASLVRIEAAFPHYRVTSYFQHDFGQGGTGLLLADPAGTGSIGLGLAAAPGAGGLVKIIAIRVGIGLHASAMELGCAGAR